MQPCCAGKMHLRAIAFLVILSGLGAVPAQAERLEIAPATSQVGFRAYGFGIVPLPGHFTRFHGWLDFSGSACTVTLRVDVHSLVMDREPARDTVLGADFMDADRFPEMIYDGTCRDGHLTGMLTLHGVTHGFELSVDRADNRAFAEGSLRRGDWGMSGKPFLAGPTVRINVLVPLTPPSVAPGQPDR